MQYVLPEDDPKNRFIKFYSAGDPNFWPKAPSRALSVFEAISQIGPAVFGVDWTGKELKAVSWIESPRAFARRIMGNGGGDARGSGRKGNYADSPAFKSVVPQEWVKSHDAHVHEWRLEQRQRKWEANQSATSRLIAVVNWLAQRCRDGELASYARLRSGGELWPIKAWEWNVENPFDRFVSDGGPKRHFTEFKHSGPYESYLFFSRLQIEEQIARLGVTALQIAEVDLSRLSPYLQLAVRLAIKKDYFSRESCETLPVREAEVRALWPESMRDIPMTQNTITLVARLIGFPDPVAIERGRKRRPGKRVEPE